MKSQYLTFKLDNSQYAVEVYKVQEVLEYTTITKLPCAESYMEGLISSRGQGISVVNLCKKFGLPENPQTKETRIIILELKTKDDTTVTFGAIADSVQEVIDLDDSEIEPSPKFGNSISAKFIRGIGKRDGNFIIILNVDQIFSTDEITNLEAPENTDVSEEINEETIES